MDKKKRVALLLMGPKPKELKEEDEGVASAEDEDVEDDVSLEDVAADLIDAIASKDKAAVADALRAAVASCSD